VCDVLLMVFGKAQELSFDAFCYLPQLPQQPVSNGARHWSDSVT